MDEATIRRKLGELCEFMTRIPPQKPKTIHPAKKGPNDPAYLPKTFTDDRSIDDAIDQLRLQIKYVVFDLEATRRENKYLRQMIENRRPPRSDDSKDGLDDF